MERDRVTHGEINQYLLHGVTPHFFQLSLTSRFPI